MKRVALATSILLAISSVANASLGSFSGSNGTDSITVTFPAAGVLDQTPSFTQTTPSPSALFGQFRTETSGHGSAIAGFSINATTASGSVDLNRISFNFLPNLNQLDIIDGVTDTKIEISNVTGPAVSGSMQLQEVMLTSNSVATIFDISGMTTQIGGPVAVPEPSAFLFGGLVLGMVGAGRFVRSRFAKTEKE